MQPDYPHPFIAREGWAIILIAFVIAAVVTAAFGMGLIATVFWVLFALVVQFFRDP
ncbi:MAG TPA: phosphatidylserine decarboxylase family protein, partial [Sutterella sp.]|nr:phosphatidylserine decarboxylase family protein [Sutterella sp.]